MHIVIMRNIRLAFLLLVAVTAAADPAGYNFIARVMRNSAQHYIVATTVQGPGGDFTAISEVDSTLDGTTITVERGTRMIRIVLGINPAGEGTAAFEVIDNGVVVAKDMRDFIAAETPPQQTDEKYLRVGGDVKAPVVVKRVEPVYTEEARKARISGIVIIEARISEAGVVDDVQVLKPLPFGLDQAAVDAVKQWEFRPATLDGKPVPVIFNLTVNFKVPTHTQP
jgi:TonB family protein